MDVIPSDIDPETVATLHQLLQVPSHRRRTRDYVSAMAERQGRSTDRSKREIYSTPTNHNMR